MAMVYNSTPKALVLVYMFWAETVCGTTLHLAAEGCPDAQKGIAYETLHMGAWTERALTHCSSFC